MVKIRSTHGRMCIVAWAHILFVAFCTGWLLVSCTFAAICLGTSFFVLLRLLLLDLLLWGVGPVQASGLIRRLGSLGSMDGACDLCLRLVLWGSALDPEQPTHLS